MRDAELQTKIRAWMADIQRQINAAKAAGVDDNDLCIACPPSYLTLVFGFPVILLDGERKVLLHVLGAEGLLRTVKAEAGMLDVGPPDRAQGLFQMLGPK